MRDWLEAMEQAPAEEALPVLAYAAGIGIELGGEEVRGATRRALLLLAAGGDPNRGLDLDGRAVTALAEELDDPGRRAAVMAGIPRLAEAAGDLPRVRGLLARLADDTELAWRAYAAGVLADALGED